MEVLEKNMFEGRPPIRVGLIGLGRFAQFHIIPEILSMPEMFRITAICDLEKERRDRVAPLLPDIHHYRRIEDMENDNDIDLFHIAVPSTLHEQQATFFLNNNHWTLVENPFTLTHAGAQMLRSISAKYENRLIIAHRALCSPEYRLAQIAREDARLGEIFEVRVRVQTYCRRDDWQSVTRCGGGCVFREGPDAMMAALGLLGMPPAQLWSDLKRVVSVGDAEDYAHITLRTRGDVSADIEINGGKLSPYEPLYEIRGSRGTFTVMPGATEGMLNIIDPAHKFPRRRSSVRTPPLTDGDEALPHVQIPLALPANAELGPRAFWNAVYMNMRRNIAMPYSMDDAVESIRYLQLVKQASPFAK